MPLSESLVDEAWRVLMDDRCVCGARKRQRMSFCFPCYSVLPAKMKRDLYKTFSEGYAEIWDEARCYLREQTDRPVK